MRPVVLSTEMMGPVSTKTIPGPIPQLIICRTRPALGDAFGIDSSLLDWVGFATGTRRLTSRRPTRDDKFIKVRAGKRIPVTDASEVGLSSGLGSGFKGGSPDAQDILKRNPQPAPYLAIGTLCFDDVCLDLNNDLKQVVETDGSHLLDNDGTPY